MSMVLAKGVINRGLIELKLRQRFVKRSSCLLYLADDKAPSDTHNRNENVCAKGDVTVVC